MKKIKVIHVITLLELGGAQGNTLHTVRNLDSSRFDVELWCGRGAYWDKEAEKLTDKGKTVRFFSRLKREIQPLFDLIAIVDLFFAFRRVNPDIVHTHSSKAGIIGRIAAHWAGVPTVLHTYHGFGFHPYQNSLIRWIYIALERFTAPMTTKLIFVSESNLADARRLGIGKESQYVLIRSGVAIEEIRRIVQQIDKSALKNSLGITGKDVILTVGAFKPQKNLLAFVEFARRLSALRPATIYIVVGDGVMRPQIERAIQKAGLHDSILLLGWRTDVASLMGVADLFVMTSLWEGLPRALVEAMIAGVPSICYKTDGVHDLLKKGGGFMVEHGEVQRLANFADELLADLDQRTAVSRSARATVTKEFDIDFMVEQQERLYLSITKPLS